MHILSGCLIVECELRTWQTVDMSHSCCILTDREWLYRLVYVCPLFLKPSCVSDMSELFWTNDIIVSNCLNIWMSQWMSQWCCEVLVTWNISKLLSGFSLRQIWVFMALFFFMLDIAPFCLESEPTSRAGCVLGVCLWESSTLTHTGKWDGNSAVCVYSVLHPCTCQVSCFGMISGIQGSAHILCTAIFICAVRFGNK